MTAEADSNAKLRIENGKLFDDEADSPKRFPPQAFHFQFSILNSQFADQPSLTASASVSLSFTAQNAIRKSRTQNVKACIIRMTQTKYPKGVSKNDERRGVGDITSEMQRDNVEKRQNGDP
ncbi:MAG TPA: hypothetical protein VK468_10600 [Pyrinomonadaceae bacterium]|nr:hypothetical protein [Pyrinomonadaceae bacterium]